MPVPIDSGVRSQNGSGWLEERGVL
jgi:hypothetical protein